MVPNSWFLGCTGFGADLYAIPPSRGVLCGGGPYIDPNSCF